MLQKLDTEHLNRLALAEALASMEQLRLRHARPDAVSVATHCAMFRERWSYVGGWESQLSAAQACSGFRLSKRGSCSFRSIAQNTTTTTLIRRMQHEWCVISRPPIPSIGRSLASFSRSPPPPLNAGVGCRGDLRPIRPLSVFSISPSQHHR